LGAPEFKVHVIFWCNADRSQIIYVSGYDSLKIQSKNRSWGRFN